MCSSDLEPGNHKYLLIWHKDYVACFAPKTLNLYYKMSIELGQNMMGDLKYICWGLPWWRSG